MNLICFADRNPNSILNANDPVGIYRAVSRKRISRKTRR